MVAAVGLLLGLVSSLITEFSCLEFKIYSNYPDFCTVAILFT